MTSGSTTMTYRYKPDSMRISVSKKLNTASPQTTIHVWDGSNIALELDNAGNLTNKYIRGINLIKTVPASGSANERYFLFNAHGDVTQMTNTSGAVTKNYYYDSFGVELNPDAADTNPWRYCGEYYDKMDLPTSGASFVGNGTIATLYFEVAANAPKGNYDIPIDEKTAKNLGLERASVIKTTKEPYCFSRVLLLCGRIS